MKYLIERTEPIFVDYEMIVFDLNDRKNGFIKAVALNMLQSWVIIRNSHIKRKNEHISRYRSIGVDTVALASLHEIIAAAIATAINS